MPPRPLRLHHRIVIPMALVALVTTSVAAIVSLSLTRRALERRVTGKCVTQARMIVDASSPVVGFCAWLTV